MAHSTEIPPVDFTPTGRALPYIPEPPREHPEIAREHCMQAETCTIWPGLCTETGDHDDHFNHELTALNTGSPVSVGFVEVSEGTPLLYVDKGLAVDFDPEDAPRVVAQLRAAADAIEDMRAKVEQGRALARLRKVREAADAAFAQVLTLMEIAMVRDGADPAEVGERVLELLAQVRGENPA